MLTGLIICVTVRPAAAAFWVEWPNGYDTFVSDDAIFWGVIIVVAFIVGAAVVSDSSRKAQLAAMDSTEYYEDEAARYRAMSRKLDAETDLAESLIKAKRTRAELDDVEQMFRNTKSSRRR
jgi:hypothetical protein